MDKVADNGTQRKELKEAIAAGETAQS
jgi:hypothetical protein